jgi:hypothetical protein
MSIIICPGIHEASITESFITGCFHPTTDREILVVPTEGILAVSAFHVLQFLRDRLKNKLRSPVVFISFSAGVVGAIGAALSWQILGGQVQAFMAIDGWGVPLWGNFPIHRLSHDYFTHWSSTLLDGGKDNFYADPSVEHLAIWRSPAIVQGRWVDSLTAPPQTYLSCAEFLHLLLNRYQETD